MSEASGVSGASNAAIAINVVIGEVYLLGSRRWRKKSYREVPSLALHSLHRDV